jgi:uncharacterized protein (TIGR00266 family)
MSQYHYKVDAAPDYSLLTISVPKGQMLKAEASSMASMDMNMRMKTRLKGGLSRLMTKESLFLNEFTAQGGDAEISLAPGPSGDIGHYDVQKNENFYLTSTSYLASAGSVNVDAKFQGFAKGFFSGEGLFMMKCSGQGDIWFNTYGALFEVEVKDEYVVDTGHIVAFTEGLDYKISKIGGYKSLFFSGEGFVARFQGEGRVWIQTKQPYALVSWADQYRITQQSNNS